MKVSTKLLLILFISQATLATAHQYYYSDEVFVNDGRTINLGPHHDRVCMLTGIQGNYNRNLFPSEGRIYQNNGHYYISSRNGSGPLGPSVWGRCVLNPKGVSHTGQQALWYRSVSSPIYMNRVDSSICHLSGIRGSFGGGGELVHIYQNNDNYYFYGTTGGNNATAGWAECLGRSPIHTETFTWHQNNPVPVNMGRVTDKVCFLTKITGRFDGDREGVRIIQSNGNWILTGYSNQADVAVAAVCSSDI